MAKIRIDGTRTQTIRTVVIAAFVALAVVIAATLGLQRLKHEGFHLDLPGELGVNVSQTANGFTYSQSQRGHTIFTIHADHVTELFKGNQSELHGVVITLYGPEGSNRKDMISGSDFLYNKTTQTVVARGQVKIDMASPAATPDGKPATTAPPDNIHIETSDLHFDQKTGDAQTSQPLAFTLPRATGKSIGGDYNSKTGVLILQSAVELHADQNGSPSVVYAQHAQLLRDSHIAYLLMARSEYQGGHDSADQAILHFRPDGSLQHLDAQNHVHMVTADGAELYSTTATADFDARSQPLTAHAGGGVNFLSEDVNSSMHGNAVEGTLLFVPGADGKASLHHATFSNAVSFVYQQRELNGDPRGSATREMTASNLNIEFAPGAGGKSVAQKAIAQGGATVNLHDLPYGAPPKHTSIHGQQLVALLTDGHELRQLDGTGGTTLTSYAPDGATDTSVGDTLHATFLPNTKDKGARAEKTGASGGSGMDSESASIDEAVQKGHVTMTAQPAGGAKNSDGTPQTPLYADAVTGTYHGADQVLHLVGDASTPPRVHNDTLAITATTIDYARATGDAVAHGDVRSTYLEKSNSRSAPGSAPGSAAPAGPPAGLGGGGPVHIVSDSARMARTTNTSVFYGSAGTAARIWQGANSVTAPVLELSKRGSSLNAHGAEGAKGDVVHSAFAGQDGTEKGHAEKASAAKPATGQPTPAGQPVKPGEDVTRVASETFFYSDTTRSGEFHGNVVAQQPNGTVHSDDAQMFLTEAPAGQPSQLDRLIATGHVVLTQPGRRGTGERLVYTSADGNYLLTGTPAVPPRATDKEHGDTTGAALLFRSSDNSVQVLSSDAEGNSRRTVTDTRTTK